MGFRNTTGIVCREVVGRRVGGIIEVNERIADGVAERVVDRAAALVPDRAFVECDRLSEIDGGA